MKVIDKEPRYEKLYTNAKEQEKRKQVLLRSIDQENGVIFSPKLFKSPKKIQQAHSPSQTVI